VAVATAEIRLGITGVKRVVADFRRATTDMRHGFDRVRQSVSRMENQLKTAAKGAMTLKNAAKGLFALYAIRDTVRAFEEQEQAVAKLNASLKTTGVYSDATSKSLQQFASQLQRTTVYGDEVTLSAMAILQGMAKLDEEGIKRLMPAIQDMASAMHMDLFTAANLVAKTIGSSTNALSRYGIQVDASLPKQEKLAAVLEQLRSHFGGMAEAEAKTATGRLRQFANTLSDVKEILGSVIVDAIMPFVMGLKQAGEWLKSLSPGVRNLGIRMAGMAAIVVKLVIPALRAMGVASNAALGWIGVAITMIAALYSAWKDNLFGIRDVTRIALKRVGDFFEGIWAVIKDIGGRIGAYYRGMFQIVTGHIKAGAKTISDALASGWAQTIEKFKAQFEPIPADVAEERGQEAGAAYGQAFASAAQAATAVTGEKIAPIAPVGAEAAPGRVRLGALPESLKAISSTVEAGVEAVMGPWTEKYQQFERTVYWGLQRLSDAFFSAFTGARVDLKSVFLGMAHDFYSFFVRGVLEQLTNVLVPKILVTLALFDKRRNDAMAMRVGEDYMNFFLRGALNTLASGAAVQLAGAAGAALGATPAQRLVGAFNLQPNIEVHIDRAFDGETFFKRTVLPEQRKWERSLVE